MGENANRAICEKRSNQPPEILIARIACIGARRVCLLQGTEGSGRWPPSYNPPNVMSKPTYYTAVPDEKAFLVGVERRDQPGALSVEDSLRELELLALTAGLKVVGRASQKIRHPDPRTFIGTGKVEEIKALADDRLADVVIFDDELSPRHQRELEDVFGETLRVVDRTALILDIFAQHAQTREGSLQVELAQYEYRLPRLTRAWTHLARQAGGGAGRSGSVGGVGLRGPGETQLEVDRREIGRRIGRLQKELEKVREHRGRHRAQRRRARVPTVALVGYTNAGKSTLLNHLAQADVYVADQLFATLDPTTRRLELPGGRHVLLTDTVGFIQKLPTMLVAAFRATLEEIAESDLLLHVVDITHPNLEAQAEAVRQTLAEIGVGRVPAVTALNKIDLLDDREPVFERIDEFERAVPVSAQTGEGFPALLAAIEHELFEGLMDVTLRLPYDQGRLISLFHEQGVVTEIEHSDEAVIIAGRIPIQFRSEFEPYLTNRRSTSDRQD
jgi:GTP-binding protein HflX